MGWNVECAVGCGAVYHRCMWVGRLLYAYLLAAAGTGGLYTDTLRDRIGFGFRLGKMGNSPDKLRHPRSVAYSAEQVLH